LVAIKQARAQREAELAAQQAVAEDPDVPEMHEQMEEEVLMQPLNQVNQKYHCLDIQVNHCNI
jgi:hypothetical protein